MLHDGVPEDSDVTSPAHLAGTIFMLLSAILIIFTNSLTIAAIFKFEKLRSITNFLILSLSFGDLCLV